MKNPFKIHYHHILALAFGRALGAWAKKRFARRLDAGKWRPTQDRIADTHLPFELFTFAGEKSFGEAVVMLDSFFANVGEPLACRVISDGTLTPRHQEVLGKIHHGIKVCSLDPFLTKPLPRVLEKRLSQNPVIKKLAALVEIARVPQRLYVDSDFVFFRAARQYDWASLLLTGKPRYMQDIAISLDPRLYDKSEVDTWSVNSGLIFFGSTLEFEPWLDRLDRLGDQLPNHFSEQTVVHLALAAAEALPVDPKRFVLTMDDLFSFEDKHAFNDQTICRHYTGTIRHKFWILAVLHRFAS